MEISGIVIHCEQNECVPVSSRAENFRPGGVAAENRSWLFLREDYI